MSFSTPQDGERPYHVLFVRADRHNASAPPGPLGAGLIAHTLNWFGGGSDPGIVDIPDVIVVDFPPTPPVDLALYSRIRLQGLGRPTIVLGPRQHADCVLSLELGADDYLGKPVAAPELTARIRAILRRRDSRPAAVHISGLLAGWDFDTRRRRLVAPDGGERKLSMVEFELLRYLIDTPFTVHSRDDLAVALYHRQDRHYEPRSVDVFINALRQKLGDKPPYTLIRTERGRGYVFTPASS